MLIQDNPWLLVPMKAEESKRKFETFIKSRTGKEYHVPKHYSSGLVMLLVSIDLEHFSLTNITSACGINYRFDGVDDFIARYDDFKDKYGKEIKEQQKKAEKYM